LAIKDWGIQILVPMHEDGLILQTFKHLLPDNVCIACPEQQEFTRALDKFEMTALAQKLEIKIPRTFLPTNVEEAVAQARQLGFPVVLKLRNGNSGKGVFILNSEAALRECCQHISEKCPFSVRSGPFLQEYIEGEVCGACFLAKKGAVVACFTERYIRCKEGRFGTRVYREPIEWPILVEYSTRMVKALRWEGIGHFDFVSDADHQSAYLIEMNPRFWGALNLAVQNGYNFPCALVAQTLGKQADSEWFKPALKKRGSLWIVGEFIACVNELRSGDWFAPFRSAKRVIFGHNISYDDFRWNDPLPFLFEVAYYAKGFIRSGFDSNPAPPGLVNIRTNHNK